MEVTFEQVSQNVWLVYLGADRWGKLWLTLPAGTWGLINLDHRRWFLGSHMSPAQAKGKAKEIVLA